MELKKGVILLLLCTLVICEASALTPDSIQIFTDKPWVVAGGTETSILTVRVENSTTPGAPISGALVSITISDPQMGSISPVSQSIGNTSQSVSFTFRPGIKSGNASISVSVTNEGVSKTNSTIQQIDHASPKYLSQISFPEAGTVATDIPIIVRMMDRYGNPVDSKREDSESREAETMIFADSPDSNGGFWSGVLNPAHQLAVHVDWMGNVTVQYRLPTHAGDNILQITAPSGVILNQTLSKTMWINIKGIPDQPVWVGSQITSPYDENPEAPNYAVANGVDIFSIYYTVYDKYNNPVPGMNISWTAYSNSTGTETKQFTTNYQGLIYLEYGPSTELHSVTLTVRIVGYPAVPVLQDDIRFTSGGPAIFTVYGNPELIASKEANSASNSFIRAHLTDNMGRPIEGEPVVFTILSDNGGGTPLVTRSSFANGSYVTTTSAATNAEGYAIVSFYPGSFPDESSANYSQNATGIAEVQASFYNATFKFGDQDTATITYKNYPYLRVETFVDPTLVDVNKTVNVTIQMTGDGYAPHRPIDVVLCDSRGETMLGDLYAFSGQSGTTNDKEVWAQIAIWNFSYQFSPRDRIGLVSFGMWHVTDALTGPSSGGYAGLDGDSSAQQQVYADVHYWPYPTNYTDFSTVDIPLSYVTSALRTQILTTNVTPSKIGIGGGGRREVPTRYGLYMALKELATKSNSSDTVKAVVLLLDDQRSGWGDPLASGTCASVYDSADPMACADWSQGKSGTYCAFADLGGCGDSRQNLATYASSLGVRIYTILLPQKNCQMDSATKDEALAIAQQTGGQEYDACSAADLDKWYQDIAQKLKIYAGANTNMALNFSTINITYNNITTGYPGSQVFAYEYQQNVSTRITSWNTTTYPNAIPDKLHVPPYPATAIPGPVNGNITYPFSLNQVNEWNTTNSLSFYVGNISIGQTWQGKFRLRALKPGFINLFGDASEICYMTDLGQNCIQLPVTLITAIQNATNTTHEQVQLDIIDGSLNATPSQSTELLNVTWTLNYTGNNPVDQRAYYEFSSDGSIWSGNWVDFGMNSTGGNPIDHGNYTLLLDVRDMVGYIKIKIFSYEIPLGGASDVEELREPIRVGQYRAANIKIS
jgi:hypothetical protein